MNTLIKILCPVVIFCLFSSDSVSTDLFTDHGCQLNPKITPTRPGNVCCPADNPDEYYCYFSSKQSVQDKNNH